MGHYQLLHPVRRDRHGMIHIAKGADGRPAAVRVLPHAVTTRAVRRRAAAGRALLTGLRHPHLARVHDIVVAGEVMIAEDALLGRTLRGPVDAAELLRVGAEIAAGLHALHEHGVRHGTLSAATVLVERGGTVRLTDVALGTVVGIDTDDLRALGLLLARLWRDTHRPWQRPPARDLLRALCAGDVSQVTEAWHGLRTAADVWADTMARARHMG